MPAAPQLGVHPGTLDQPITQVSRVTQVSPGLTGRSAAPGRAGENDGFDTSGTAMIKQAGCDRVELSAGSAYVVVDEDEFPGCPCGLGYLERCP